MKKYQFSIEGMHCNGCSKLIQMELEDQGFSYIEVYLNGSYGIVYSNMDIDFTKQTLDKAFYNLKDYKYYNLIEI